MSLFFARWNGVQWGCATIAVVILAFPVWLTWQILSDNAANARAAAIRPELLNGEASTGVSLWKGVPEQIRESTVPTGESSNIHPDDYAGPDACRNCHAKNYNNWSGHAHRWMNTLATSKTIKGQFGQQQTISYLGGTARFLHYGDAYRMHLERDGVARTYRVRQTIGSRFFQYYVGRLETGPEPPGHVFYREDHVLPFGYWLEEEEWVPIVHIREELPDGERADPFDPPASAREGLAVYAETCSICHTTFPLAEVMIRDSELLGRHTPRKMHLETTGYLAENHSQLWQSLTPEERQDPTALTDALDVTRSYEAPDHAVTLGISCEACHLGSAEHAKNPEIKPAFYPQSPHLRVEDIDEELEFGRSHTNVNWACARCHAGHRPYYAAGMSTWNSTEYSDAVKGSCYSQLTCINCHDPHTTIGPEWSLTSAEDDANCLQCHQHLEPEQQRVDHTHHPIGSPGSACMNCHMPRLNEGLQDVVRTHTIFSPTNREMIESNQPNACNMCHTDQGIGWTLSHLRDWYGAEFDSAAIAEAYEDEAHPVGAGWMKSENEAVRLIGADSLARSKGRDAAPHLLDALDDPFLINRQFARTHLERLFGIRLESHGYRFYMTPEERTAPIEKIRAEILPE